jgi:hypothetical protein
MLSSRHIATAISQSKHNHNINQGFGNSLAPGELPCKFESDRARIDAGQNAVLPQNSFLIEAIESIPADARMCKETSLSWLDVECGAWAELRGATQLYKPASRAVIAVVTDQAYLTSFGEGNRIPISKGIWRICPPE